MRINLIRKSLNADYIGNYFQNTILFAFIAILSTKPNNTVF